MKIRDLSPQQKQAIIERLEDLRKALLISVVAIIIAAIFCYCYNKQLMNIAIYPLSKLHQKLIVTALTEAFFIQLKLSFFAGLILAFPVAMWAIWRSFKPAIKPSWRKYIYWLFPAVLLLFLGGILFSYFVVLPIVLKFFVYIAGKNLKTMFKLDQYVSFVVSFILPFGIIFEMPVVFFFLSKVGLINYEFLAKNRKYAILISVIIAAALIPSPDPISQILLASPTYLLYEISIWITKFATPSKSENKAA
jgi:sec-independent protein translocase protein TatC